MAKAPKKAATEGGKLSGLETLVNALDACLGDNDEAQSVSSFIDTGYAPLNSAMSGRPDGGLPQGRMIEVFGESSTGKTALATNWMVKAQQMGGIAIFEDWERSFDVDLARGFGLNTERPYWIYKRPKTWEEGNIFTARACKAIRDAKVIPPDAPIIAVHDSIAAAIPHSVLYDAKGNVREIDTYNMNDTTALARVSSTTLKNMAQIAGEFNATFVYLNQLRLKPGVMFGDPRTTPGGKAMEFYATVRLALGREKLTEAGGEFTGQRINIQVVKTKLCRPFQTVKLRMMYDEMDVAYFDAVLSGIEFLLERKILARSGSRIEWVDGTKPYASELLKRIESSEDDAKIFRDMLASALAKATEE